MLESMEMARNTEVFEFEKIRPVVSERGPACAHCPAHARKFRMRACGRSAAAGDRETEGQRDRETETERQGGREAEGCGLPS